MFDWLWRGRTHVSFEDARKRLYASRPIDPRHEPPEFVMNGRPPPWADEHDAELIERFDRFPVWANKILDDTPWRIQRLQTTRLHISAIGSDSPSSGLCFKMYFNEFSIGNLEIKADWQEWERRKRVRVCLEIREPRLMQFDDHMELCAFLQDLFVSPFPLEPWRARTEREEVEQNYVGALLKCLWDSSAPPEGDNMDVFFCGSPTWFLRIHFGWKHPLDDPDVEDRP